MKTALGELFSIAEAEQGSKMRRNHRKRMLQKIIEVFQ